MEEEKVKEKMEEENNLSQEINENPELSKEQINELLEKSKNNESEAKFLLQIETRNDYRMHNYWTRHFDILYGKAKIFVISKNVEDEGDIEIYNNIIIPATRYVIVRIKEESSNEEWSGEYFY
ncbi:MAG: hypothetical protein OWS74_04300, partial [Firmicutes bacterium]|nr:hypothetical protein [Bacillota bacterium]